MSADSLGVRAQRSAGLRVERRRPPRLLRVGCLAAVLVQAVVVEPVDPFGGGESDGGGGVPELSRFDQFRLVWPVDRLGQAVVIRVATVPTEAAMPASARRSV